MMLLYIIIQLVYKVLYFFSNYIFQLSLSRIRKILIFQSFFINFKLFESRSLCKLYSYTKHLIALFKDMKLVFFYGVF